MSQIDDLKNLLSIFLIPDSSQKINQCGGGLGAEAQLVNDIHKYHLYIPSVYICELMIV